MSNKKEYSAREAAVAILDKVKAMAKAHQEKLEIIKKAAPQNQTFAQASGIKVPQPSAPKAPEKVIDNTKSKELKLKKFMDHKNEKKLQKTSESKHDRCAKEVKEKNPEVENPHAVCVAAGVKPAKWSK